MWPRGRVSSWVSTSALRARSRRWRSLVCSPTSGTGRGHSRARDLIYEHDLDQIEIRCDQAPPLQVDGEDLGDVDAAQFECERAALRVLV